MATKKITELAAAGALTGAELLELVQGGVNVKGLLSAIKSFATSELLGARTAYTPTVAAGAGAITTLGAVAGKYRKVDKEVSGDVQFAITTNGSGSAYITVTLPFAPLRNIAAWGMDYNSHPALVGYGVAGSTTMLVFTAAGGYPGFSGFAGTLSFQYEVA